ncbi:MAG: thioesterase family protein [Chitinophagales bacterium]
MERVRIALPEKILFTTHFFIGNDDINEADHMGNERILVFTNNIRSPFFKQLKLTENDFDKMEGTIVANHSIHYVSEGFLGEEICCDVGITNLSECSFDVVFHFKKKNGKTLAVVRSGCVYYDYIARKIRALPENFINAFTV